MRRLLLNALMDNRDEEQKLRLEKHVKLLDKIETTTERRIQHLQAKVKEYNSGPLVETDIDA